MLKKLVVSLILATILLTVATPALAGPADDLIGRRQTELTSAQRALEVATAAKSAQNTLEAKNGELARARQAAALRQQDAYGVLLSAYSAGPLLKETLSLPATSASAEALVDTIGRVLATNQYLLENRADRRWAFQNALALAQDTLRLQGDVARLEGEVALAKTAFDAAMALAQLAPPAPAAPPAPTAVAPVVVAPSATPATVTAPAPASPSAAEVQLRKELAAEKARANQLAGRVAELEKKAVATPAPTAAAPTSLRPAERAEDTPDAGTWPQNLPVAPAAVAAPTPATPAAATPAPATPVAAAPVSAPAATTPATAPVAPSAAIPVTAPAEPMATKASVGALEKRIDEQEARLVAVEETVKKLANMEEAVKKLTSKIEDLTTTVTAQAEQIIALRDKITTFQDTVATQAGQITTLRGDLNALRAQLFWTWISLGCLALLGLLAAIAIGVRRWMAARTARRRQEERDRTAAAAVATGSSLVVAPPTGSRAPGAVI